MATPQRVGRPRDEQPDNGDTAAEERGQWLGDKIGGSRQRDQRRGDDAKDEGAPPDRPASGPRLPRLLPPSTRRGVGDGVSLVPAHDTQGEASQGEGAEQAAGVQVAQEDGAPVRGDQHQDRDGHHRENRPVRCVPRAVALGDHAGQEAQACECQEDMVAPMMAVLLANTSSNAPLKATSISSGRPETYPASNEITWFGSVVAVIGSTVVDHSVRGGRSWTWDQD